MFRRVAKSAIPLTASSLRRIMHQTLSYKPEALRLVYEDTILLLCIGKQKEAS